MKKSVVVLGLIGAMMMGGSAYAAPLQDFSLGKVSLEVGINVLPAFRGETHNKYKCVDSNAAHKEYVAGTVGLGKKWAIQYKHNASKGYNETFDARYSTNEYNVLYKAAKSLDVYAGLINNKQRMLTPKHDVQLSANAPQIGVQYTQKIGKNMSAWVNGGLGGNKTRHYELGVGYEFTKHIGLDLAYKCYTSEVEDGNFKNQGLYVNLAFNF